MSNAKNLATFLQSGGSIAGDANFDSNTLFVDSSANRVGIGNASPTTPLDVTGTITSDGLTLDNNGSIIFNDPQATDTILIGTNDDDLVIRADAGDIVLKTNNNSTSAVVDASGNVGVGTSSPSGLMSFAKGSRTLDLKLEDSPATGDSGVQFRAGSGDFLGLAAGGGTGVGIVINDSNNVGIGNSSAQTRLFVGDGSGTEGITIYSGTTGEGQLRFADGTSGSALYQGRVEYNHSTNKLFLGAGGTTPVAIDSSGRVGIGTSSPSRQLHVSGSGANTRLRVENTTGSNVLDIYAEDGGNSTLNYSSVLTMSESGTERMRIDSAGRVGIGANISSYPASGYDSRSNDFVISGAGDTGLTIAGGSTEDIRLVFTANGTSGLSKGSLTYDNANDSLAIETSGTGRMTVDGNGLVLIGTTDTSPYNNSAGSSADNGVVVSAGRIWAARHSGTPMDLNRTSDDGTLIDFRKNGSVVGQIGVSGNGFFFGDEGDTGFVMDSNSDALIPFNPSTRAIRNNAIDLGSSSGRFGNLYLGNSVNLAPTVQNALTEIEFGVLNAGTTAFAKIDAANFVNYDTNLRFFTNAASSTTQVERMRISSTGQLFLFTQTSGAGNATLKYTTGTGAVTYDTSSRLVKENIVDCPYGLTEVVQLQPRKYFRTDDQANEVGLIADEVQSIMPEFVPTGEKSLITGIEEDTEIIPLGVNYDKMVAPLVQAIKDLNAKIETLETKVATLEGA